MDYKNMSDGELHHTLSADAMKWAEAFISLATSVGNGEVT